MHSDEYKEGDHISFKAIGEHSYSGTGWIELIAPIMTELGETRGYLVRCDSPEKFPTRIVEGTDEEKSRRALIYLGYAEITGKLDAK